MLRRKNSTVWYTNDLPNYQDSGTSVCSIDDPSSVISANTKGDSFDDSCIESTCLGGQSAEVSFASYTSFPNKYGFIGGCQYRDDSRKNLSTQRLRKREVKWIEMINKKDYIRENINKVRSRCRKGIPSAVRGKAWLHLCGAHEKMKENKGLFDKIVNSPCDEHLDSEIRKDIARQFPNHELFIEDGGFGQENLYKVLKVNSMHSEMMNDGDGDGYCQAHASIAATLLMQMPVEEAYWCLNSICNDYLKGYFSKEMKVIKQEGYILEELLRTEVSLSVYKTLKKHGIEPVIYMMEWFSCLYCRNLPWPSVLRVWDMFFCEGPVVLFRVGLVLLKHGLREEVLNDCSNYYEIIQSLFSIDSHVKEEQFLIREIHNIGITLKQLRDATRKILENTDEFEHQDESIELLSQS